MKYNVHIKRPENSRFIKVTKSGFNSVEDALEFIEILRANVILPSGTIFNVRDGAKTVYEFTQSDIN